MPVADHFAPVADQYAAYRPTYPVELYRWLAAQCGARDLAWDCGAGSGQASAGLVEHFRRVIATDSSAAQIARAVSHPRIEYRVAPAERSGLEDHSADVVTVAQALHWFDLDAFYAGARRVLTPGGVIAVWSYAALTFDAGDIDRAVQRFYHDEVGPFWPPERRHVEAGYRDLPFPFIPIACPDFSMRAEWPLGRLLGYIRSWSATARYVEAKGMDPVERLAGELGRLWGDPERARVVVWPLAVRAGRAGSRR